MNAVSPPKYPSTKQWPWSDKIHRDDTVHRNPSFFLGKEVVVTEKLDGGNTSLYQGSVFARSVDSPAHQGWFAMVKKYHGWKTSGAIPEWPQSLVMYGEDMYGIHSLEYDAMRRNETYRTFAVRETAFDIFMPWDKVVHYAEMLGLKTVPVVFRGVFTTTEEITTFFRLKRLEPSSIGGEREGFVMRIADGFHADNFGTAVTKYVRPGHVQTDEHWTENWQPCKILP